MAILTVEDLTFTYSGAKEPALRNLSMEIQEGEFILLCGPSGCGKTTFLRACKPELAPFGRWDGSIRCDGKPLDRLDERRSAAEIGYVMQNPDSQIVTDQVWHELAFGLENLGLPSPVIRLRVAEMASFFGISGWFHCGTAELSGGQKQLLNLAAIMAMQPRLLLLDEPTSQLDPIAASEFLETVRRLNRETGLTVLLAEHRLEEAYAMADRVVVMERGAVLTSGAPGDVGKRLHEMGRGDILCGFPTALRVYHGLGVGGDCPLTVREGRGYLSAHCTNLRIDRLPGESGPEGRKEAALEARRVFFRYSREGEDVLRGLNYRAYRGELSAILGANGCGKTTLLSLLSGVGRPCSGKVLLEGRELSAYRAGSLYRGWLAALPQNPQAVFVRDRLGEDLLDAAAGLGWKDATGRERVSAVAKRLGLDGLLDRHPYDLSGGEQQRAALAKLLLCEPTILLLDEPTKGLDSDAKRELAAILRGLARKGAAVVVVTHDVEFAAEYADRCALLFDGEIVSEGRPRGFFPNNRFYTTAANRMSRHLYQNAVTSEDVIRLCRENMEPPEEGVCSSRA